jgi:hypothetical protein
MADGVVEKILKLKDEASPVLRAVGQEAERQSAKMSADIEKAAKAEIDAAAKAAKARQEATRKSLADELKAAKEREAAAEALVRKVEDAERRKVTAAEKTFNTIDKAAKQTPLGGIIGDIADVGEGLQALPPAAGAAAAGLLGLGIAGAGLAAVVSVAYSLGSAFVALVSSTNDNIHALDKYKGVSGLVADVTDDQRRAAERLNTSWEVLSATQTKFAIDVTKDAVPGVTAITTGLTALTLAANDAAGGDFWTRNWEEYFKQWELFGQTLVVLDYELGGNHWTAAIKSIDDLAKKEAMAADNAARMAEETARYARAEKDAMDIVARRKDEYDRRYAAIEELAAEELKKAKELAKEKRKLIDDLTAYNALKDAENYAAMVRYQNQLADLYGRKEVGLGGNGVAPTGTTDVRFDTGKKNEETALTQALTSAIEAAFKADATTAGMGDKKASEDADQAVHKALTRVQAIFSNGFEGLFSGGAMKGIGGAIGAALDFAPIADEMLKKLPETLQKTIKILPSLISETIPAFVKSMITEVIPALFKMIPEIILAFGIMLKDLVIFLGHLLNPFDDNRDETAATTALSSNPAFGSSGGASSGSSSSSTATPSGSDYIASKKSRSRFASGGTANQDGWYFLEKRERVIPPTGTMTGAARAQAGGDGGGTHYHFHGTLIGGEAAARELVRLLNSVTGTRNLNLTVS